MNIRIVARIIFILGVLSLAIMLLLNRWRTPVVSDPEFVAATTLVTDENFADVVLASDKPVVLDFYGAYCPVC